MKDGDQVPKGYKQTEVGVIPEDWSVSVLGAAVRGIYRGASPRPIDDPKWFDVASNIGWVRISDVTQSGRYLTETTQRLSQDGVRNSRYVPSGALIMSICATVGRPVETRIDTCIHDGFVLFDTPSTDQDFLYHILKNLEPHWSSKGQTGSQMNLNTGLIKSTRIPLPPSKAEQEAIAEALSDADAFIESLEQLIAKKRQIKQGAMHQLLTGTRRLPSFETASGYKPSEVGLIPEDWVVSTVGAEFSIQLGKMLDIDKNAGTPKPFLGNRAVQWGRIDLADMGEVKLTPSDLQRFRLREGDLLVCEGGEVGRAAIWHQPIEECYYQKALHRLRSIRGCDVELMLNVLHRLASNGSLANFVTQTSIAHLPKDKFETVPITLPSTKAEQVGIATVLSDMDTEITALEGKLTKARHLKQGMMQELLTGRIRLV